MKKTKSFKEFIRTNGIYLGLGVCLLAAVAGSFFRLESGLTEIRSENASLLESQKKTSFTETETPLSGVSKPSELSSVREEESSFLSPSSTPSEETESSEEFSTSEPLLYILPAAGKIGERFSGDALIYYPTLKLWKVHQALDVIAPVSTPVKAMADGQVTKCFEDSLLGVAVRIQHPDGMISTIYGLSPKLTVKEGQQVKVGDILGVVAGVPSESDHSGLHITMQSQEGIFLDPEAYIRSGS